MATWSRRTSSRRSSTCCTRCRSGGGRGSTPIVILRSTATKDPSDDTGSPPRFQGVLRRRLRMTVYLVGAGPGEQGLITLLGDELLVLCDAIFYNAFAN